MFLNVIHYARLNTMLVNQHKLLDSIFNNDQIVVFVFFFNLQICCTDELRLYIDSINLKMNMFNQNVIQSSM